MKLLKTNKNRIYSPILRFHRNNTRVKHCNYQQKSDDDRSVHVGGHRVSESTKTFPRNNFEKKTYIHPFQCGLSIELS